MYDLPPGLVGMQSSQEVRQVCSSGGAGSPDRCLSSSRWTSCRRPSFIISALRLLPQRGFLPSCLTLQYDYFEILLDTVLRGRRFGLSSPSASRLPFRYAFRRFAAASLSALLLAVRCFSFCFCSPTGAVVFRCLLRRQVSYLINGSPKSHLSRIRSLVRLVFGRHRFQFSFSRAFIRICNLFRLRFLEKQILWCSILGVAFLMTTCRRWRLCRFPVL